MAESLLIVALKFGGYFLVSRAIIILAITIKDLKPTKDEEPKLEEIVKKPRMRR